MHKFVFTNFLLQFIFCQYCIVAHFKNNSASKGVTSLQEAEVCEVDKI